jgi:hypothetical protein
VKLYIEKKTPKIIAFIGLKIAILAPLGHFELILSVMCARLEKSFEQQ